MMMEDYAKTSKNLRRHLTARSQERCLNKLRSEDIEKLQQFCKLHISFLTDMGSSSSFDELFGDKQQQLPKGKFSNFLARKKSTGKVMMLIDVSVIVKQYGRKLCRCEDM